MPRRSTARVGGSSSCWPFLLSHSYLLGTSILCLQLTSPAWFPRLCSLLSFFFLTAVPDLATGFLLSPKFLFVVSNLIVAFLVGESRLAPRRVQPSLVNEIHEEHVKRNKATILKVTADG
jgi:hypothetical protein